MSVCRHIFLLVFAGGIFGVVSLPAQDRPFGVGGSFYSPPAPSDFYPDTGEDSDGSLLDIFSKKPFEFAFALRQGYDDNLFTTRTNKNASLYTNLAGGGAYEFRGPRLQFTTNLGAGITYYYSRPGDKADLNGLFSLTASYLATPRLTLSIESTTAFLSQPDPNLIGNPNRALGDSSNSVDGDYVYTQTIMDATYRLTEKLSSVTGYALYGNYYMEDSLNNSLSFVSQMFKQSFRFLLLPKTTVLAEYRANPINYLVADQNSFGNFLVVGFDQTFNPRFKWTLRAGVEQRFINNPVDGPSTYLGPYGESNLIYQFGPLSTLSWSARYGTEPSSLTNVSQRRTFRTGLVVVHGFTPRISGNLGINFERDYYDQAGVISTFTEDVFGITIGANFKVSRLLTLNAGYQFTSVQAPDAMEFEYTRNVMFVGVSCDL